MKNIGRNNFYLGNVNLLEKQDELFWLGDSIAPAVLPLKPVVPDTTLNVVNYFGSQGVGVSASISANIAAKTGDLIVIKTAYSDNAESTAWTVSNTGTAITWTKKVETNTATQCKVVVWTGVAGAIPPQSVTVTSTAGSAITNSKVIDVDVARNAGTDIVNIFSGNSASNVSQAITPTTANSAVRLFTADWSQTNSSSAGANTQLTNVADLTGQMTVAAYREIPDPLTSNTPVTIVGNSSSPSNIVWAAYEIPLAATGAVNAIGQSIMQQLGQATATVTAITVQGTGQSIQAQLETATANVQALTVQAVGQSVEQQLLQATATVQTLTIQATGQSVEQQFGQAVGTIAGSLVQGTGQTVQEQTGTAVATVTALTVQGVGQSTEQQSAQATANVTALVVNATGLSTEQQSASSNANVVTLTVNATGQSVEEQIARATATVQALTVQGIGQTVQEQIETANATVAGGAISASGQSSQSQVNTATATVDTSGGVTVIKPKGAGKKSGKKALTYEDRKKIDEQVFDAIFNLSEEIAEKADISKDFVTSEFVNEIVKADVDNVSISSFYDSKPVIDKSFYEETAKIKTELILRKLQEQQEKDDEEALLLLL